MKKTILKSLKWLAMSKKLLVGSLILLSSAGNAQLTNYRQDLNALSASDRSTLVNLMQQYISKAVVETHACAHHSGYDIHSTTNFLPFHRSYIEGLEDYLISQGYPQFVPLPKWDPNTATPNEFRLVDADCGLIPTNCNNGTCNNPTNWNPLKPLPNQFKLPVLTGSNNDLCDFLTQAPFSNCIEGEGGTQCPGQTYHNSVHVAMSGVMGNFKSPAAPIFFPWHAYVDDVWKNWQCKCQNPTAGADLFMKDTSRPDRDLRDDGTEPNADNGPMWISEDIWVRNLNDGVANQTSQEIEYTFGQPAYVYVRIRNRGCQPSSGTEQLRLYWAKASTGLSWPTQWDNYVVGGVQYGDDINTQTIPVIAPGKSTILVFQWTTPNPDLFNSFGVDKNHFCLLARIPQGMTYTETSDVNLNTKNNNNIVWRNVTVKNAVPGIATGGGGGVKGKVFVRNVNTAGVTRTKLAFKVAEEDLDHSILDEGGEITIRLGQALFDKWNKGGRIGDGVEVVNELPVTFNIDPSTVLPLTLGTTTPNVNPAPKLVITKPDAYIDNIMLDADETHLIDLDINMPANTDPHNVKNLFKYDIVQLNTDDATAEVVVGGERYNINNVLLQTLYGINTDHQHDSDSTHSHGHFRKGRVYGADNAKLTQGAEESKTGFSAYPNPAESLLNIRFDDAGSSRQVRLVDLLGREVYNEVSDKSQLNINVKAFPKGMYLIEITDQNSNARQVSRIMVN
jgi:hypothetical protein